MPKIPCTEKDGAARGTLGKSTYWHEIMAAGRSVGSVTLSESDIRGAKLEKNVENLSRAGAERWLKCRGCRNLSEFTLNGLKSK